MDETIIEIKWVIEDLRVAYKNRYGRNATDEEIDEILNRLDVKRLEEACIEAGWNVIDEAI